VWRVDESDGTHRTHALPRVVAGGLNGPRGECGCDSVTLMLRLALWTAAAKCGISLRKRVIAPEPCLARPSD